MFVRRDLTDKVPTPEGNMHFVKQGSGYPLVMLHPLGTSTWAWHTVIDSLSQHYTCYAFDMLGHGESDKPQRHFNIPDYANALDHACQVLNIHRGHYVGNSVGAVLATEMAASFPERLDKLVLVGAPVWDPRIARQRLEEASAGYGQRRLTGPAHCGGVEGRNHVRRPSTGVGGSEQPDKGPSRRLGQKADGVSCPLRHHVAAPQNTGHCHHGYVRRDRPASRRRGIPTQQHRQRQQSNTSRAGPHPPNRRP